MDESSYYERDLLRYLTYLIRIVQSVYLTHPVAVVRSFVVFGRVVTKRTLGLAVSEVYGAMVTFGSVLFAGAGLELDDCCAFIDGAASNTRT